MASSRGLLEDLRVGSEVAVGRAFGAARRLLHRLLWLEAGRGGDRESSPAELLARRMRRVSQQLPDMPTVTEEAAQGAADAAAGAAMAASAAAAAAGPGGGASAPARPAGGAPSRRSARRPPLKSLLRSGRHWEEDLSVWTASDVILREGYPLEQHSVTTQGEPPRPVRPMLAPLPMATGQGSTPGGAACLMGPPRPRPARLPCRRRLRAADAPHPAPRRPRRRLLPARRARHLAGMGERLNLAAAISCLCVHLCINSRPAGLTHSRQGGLRPQRRWRTAQPRAATPQVSNGVVGSAAFAAYDAGFDVW